MSRAEHYPKLPDRRRRPAPNRGISPNENRNREIALRVIVGWETLEAVAQDHGISRERVRQIVNRYDPTSQRPSSGQGQCTIVSPNSDPMERRADGKFRNRPFRDHTLHRRQTKAWRRSRDTRLRVIRVVGEFVKEHGEMPNQAELKEMGIKQATIQASFSGVRRFHTGIRRLCRLVGVEPRASGHPGWSDESKRRQALANKANPC